MAFQMIDLPYKTTALSPAVSKKTLEVHYGKHYKKYVDTLNKLVAGTPAESLTLEEIIKANFKEDNGIYHNAAQAWNHAFLWQSMSPKKSKPSAAVVAAINESFGSLQDFKTKFSEAATKLFGSGWVWVVKKTDGRLAIEAMGNAGNPLTQDEVPLIVCDVWEHAYYLDYQNQRDNYVKQFWQIFNWNFLEENLNAKAAASDSKSVDKKIPAESQLSAH